MHKKIFGVVSFGICCVAVCCGALADDAPPTPGEVVGYAQSLARRAAQGDKQALTTL